MKLQDLIISLRKVSSSNNNDIPNIEEVLKYLEEMDSMIEMDEVKNLFVNQILLIVMMKKNGHRLPFSKMHTVLSGPPGVGKTTMSILIAKTWISLGMLEKSGIFYESISPDTEMIIHYKKTIAEIMTEVIDKISDAMIILDNEFDDTHPDLIPEYVKDLYSKSSDASELSKTLVMRYSKYFTELNDNNDIEESRSINSIEAPYVILGRGDFVGAYQGETSQKTKKILEENKGKVIIIEEAYTLFTSERDSYGMEALTLINRYMDERPNDYIFIFNGYIDKLNETIFKAQPGLRRRIQWKFDVEGYTPLGTFQIFKHQLGKFKSPEWKICKVEEPKFIEFFKREKEYFPYFGGDTERLILQCQLKYGEEFFEKSDHDFIITFDIFEKAFEKYKKNMHKGHEICLTYRNMYI